MTLAVLLLAALPAFPSHNADPFFHVLEDVSGADAMWSIPSALLPNAFPTQPMRRGVWQLAVSPAYYKYSLLDSGGGGRLSGSSREREMDSSGFGGSASALRAFSDRFGVFGMVGVVKGSGESLLGVALNDSGGEAGDIRSSDDSFSSFVAVAGVVLDLVRSRRFRLPVVLGAGYQKVALDRAAVQTVSGHLMRLRSDFDWSTIGLVAGLAPQFEAGKRLRITPFFMLLQPADDIAKRRTLENLSTPASRTVDTPEDTVGVEALGVEFTYKPWNLSFLWNLSAATSGVKAYNLRWVRQWGGD